MKRRNFCAAAGVTLAAFTLPAAGQEETEAIKFDLYEVVEDEEVLEETEIVVGWIAANTTDAGLLVVEVHLDQGDPLTWFDVFVEVNHEIHEEDLGWLLTDEQGMGYTQVAMRLADYPEDPADPDNIRIQAVISWAVED